VLSGIVTANVIPDGGLGLLARLGLVAGTKLGRDGEQDRRHDEQDRGGFMKVPAAKKQQVHHDQK